MAEKYYSEIKDVHLSSNNYILVVPGWYPTWQDVFTGDFNQRHVKAAGQYMPQVVLYIVKDQSQTLTGIETRYKQLTENIVEITVMYPAKRNKWIDTIYSNLSYLKLLYAYAEIIKSRWGIPRLIHSYIVIRGGVGGFLLSKKWKIPFILSENWTIYYPEDPAYLGNRNVIFRWLVKLVFKNVKRFLPVTDNLKKQVYSLVKPIPSTVIPNAVDTDVFYYDKELVQENTFRFVHVSTMVYQKNPLALLRAFKKFTELFSGGCLYMVGPYPQDVLTYARSIGLDENAVRFTGAVSYPEVAEMLTLSQVLVLFSRYENLPCVILEALCCGLPVISTNVGGISEVIDTNNGILVNNEDEQQLTDAFTSIFTTYKNYDREKIALTAASLFAYKTVGNSINTVYQAVKLQG
ncbi:glycosyltransferase family 4 protein [Segetibacter koreensis]|uniref:glycosyltransferase family 4 protein n=1 Tax=Segetibacter koreensis TaxID=398037 RepID=UPI00036A121F|nr:glycosyltransferase family 4 protein [Segetibacter koreensis]